MTAIYDDSIFWVDVEKVRPNPYQPRREFDETKLSELAESIRQYGILQPLVVTRHEREREEGGLVTEYELIAGERRLRASKIAGLSQVPVLIRTVEDTDQMKLELAIIENLQREDLNPIDRGRAFKRLEDEFGFTRVEIGKKIGRSRAYVANTLRILGLPEEIQQGLADGKISEGHTRPLLMLEGKPQEQMTLFKEILSRKLSVREAEKISRSIAIDRVRKMSLINPEIRDMEQKLSDTLGTRVSIEGNIETGGRLIIKYFSAEELNGLLEKIAREREEAPAEKTPMSAATEGQTADETDTQADDVPTDAPADLAESMEQESDESPDEVVEQPEPAPEPQKKEDDDLYSLKNFSI